MTDLAQALHDEAALMRSPLFGPTIYDPIRNIPDMLERIARRLEGHDVTAEWETQQRAYIARLEAERAAEIERFDS